MPHGIYNIPLKVVGHVHPWRRQNELIVELFPGQLTVLYWESSLRFLLLSDNEVAGGLDLNTNIAMDLHKQSAVSPVHSGKPRGQQYLRDLDIHDHALTMGKIWRFKDQKSNYGLRLSLKCWMTHWPP